VAKIGTTNGNSAEGDSGCTGDSLVNPENRGKRPQDALLNYRANPVGSTDSGRSPRPWLSGGDFHLVRRASHGIGRERGRVHSSACFELRASAMGRAEYYEYPFDQPAFSQPPLEDYQASVDDAGPIGTGIRAKVVREATRCYFDHEGDLVYGDEVPFLELTRDAYTWHLPQAGPLTKPALVFETNDPSLRGHAITFTEFPYSRTDRGFARLKGVSHHAKNDQIWQDIEDALLKKEKSIARIFDAVKHDLWRTYGDSLRAYIFEPLQEAADVFTNQQASKPQYDQAKVFQASGTSDWQLPEDLPPGLAAIYEPPAILLFGIVEDYDAAMSWLLGHPSIVRLLDLAESGELFLNESQYQRKHLPQAAREKALSILEASAHNVLCGTFDPAEYRGSVESKRSQGMSHKQTLATHLKYLFLDTMDNFRRRKPVQSGPQQFEFEDHSQHEAKAQVLEPETFSDRIEHLKEYWLSDDPPNRKALGLLTAALRYRDEVELFTSLALTVALHEHGRTDKKAVAAIYDLNANLGSFDEATQQAIQAAVARLPQSCLNRTPA